ALILAPECYAPIREIGAAFHASDTGREVLRRVRRAIGMPATPSDVQSGDEKDSADADRVATSGTRTGLVRTAPAPGRSENVAVLGLTITHAGRAQPAVAGLPFAAAPLDIPLLAGNSGAGKSTVLAVLAGRGAELDDDARCSGAIVSPPADEIVWMPQ